MELLYFTIINEFISSGLSYLTNLIHNQTNRRLILFHPFGFRLIPLISVSFAASLNFDCFILFLFREVVQLFVNKYWNKKFLTACNAIRCQVY